MTRVPRWVRAVLARGLRAAPDARFESMRGLLDALRAGHARSQRRKGGVAGLAIGALLLVTAVCARGRGDAAPRQAFGGIEARPAETAPLPRAEPAVPSALPTPAPGTSCAPPSIVPLARAAGTAAPTARPASSTPPPRQPVRSSAPRVGNNGALILED